MNNTKNYNEQGGEKLVIGGTLEITTDGQFILKGTELTRADAQVDSVATTIAELKSDFNALLLKLRNAGFIASE